MKKKQYIFKVLVAGDASVGKTSLLRRYVEGIFDENSIMTVGVDFFIKKLYPSPSVECSLLLWDLSGQERFRSLMSQYIMGARSALLLIDLTREFKIDNLVEWINIIRMNDLTLPIILVGTKYDLEDFIVVDDNIAYQVKEIFKIVEYIKTSAKTGHNINAVFNKLTKILIKK